MRMEKKSATTHFLLSALFGLSVFLFFGLVYPHHLHYHEQFQLFLSTPAYFLQLMAKPGGLAEYMASFLTQFFLFFLVGSRHYGRPSYLSANDHCRGEQTFT